FIYAKMVLTTRILHARLLHTFGRFKFVGSYFTSQDRGSEPVAVSGFLQGLSDPTKLRAAIARTNAT
ncbi:hypothetical protein, partial [Salmonella enterica]|uniref:hypothetical protein n=1 Tax=Salmonella enterica TaxID=28901 RepID=UPI00398C4A68